MADPDTAAAAARLAAAFGSMIRPPVFYGGGPAIPSTDGSLLHVLADYVAHHPHERSGLTEALRTALVSANDHPASFRFAPTVSHYLQGSYPSNASAMTELFTRHLVADHCDYSLLESHRSDVASLARFSQRVDHATWYLFVAIDPQVSPKHWHKPGVTFRRSPKSWYSALARQCFSRWKSTRELLITDWSIPDMVEPLYRTAFWSLCELTPADSQLKSLFELDRFRACRELVRHVDAYAEQLALATDLAETMAEDETAAVHTEDDARRGAIQTALLERAGERLTLTEAAERLKITRQALHKKIKGDAALGLMIGETFVVPSAQFVTGDSATRVVAHLKDVLPLFSKSGAGSWSALQYLIEPDPALGGAVPLDLLKIGEAAKVIASARGYLGLDEG